MAEGRGATARWAGLIMAGLLTGCAAGGPLPSDPGVPGGEMTLAAFDGSDLAVSAWGPAEPDAVILALHGYGDYGDSTFRLAAAHWATEGIATIAPDQRGFGRNPSRGRWPGADGLIADAIALTEQVRALYPCAPLTLLGHSMGGGVALAATANGAAPDALLLAAPAIWGGEKLNPLHRLIAWLGALTVPERRFTGRGIVRIQASDNIEMLRGLGRDPLYLSPPSAREIFGLVRVTDRAYLSAPKVETPTLMILGEKDQILPRRTVLEVFAELPGETEVIDYPEGWHLLFRDLQAERVWRDVAAWVPRAKAGTAGSCRGTE